MAVQDGLPCHILQPSPMLALLPLRVGHGGALSYDEHVGAGETPLEARETLLLEAERIAHVGSWVWDMAAGSLALSDNFYRLLGYEPGAFEPTLDWVFEAVHPDDRDHVRQHFDMAVERELAPPMEYRIVRPDGAVRTLLAQGRAARDSDGRVLRMVGTAIDLTERRERELAVERARELLEDAQAVAGVGSWVWDPSCEGVVWSDELRRIAGLPADAPLSADSLGELLHPDDRPGFATMRAQALDGHRTEPMRARLRRTDGKERQVELRARLVSGVSGGSSVVGVVHDITERHLLEQHLQRSKTVEATGRLAAGLAHDFNNLLTVVLANAQMLANERPSDKIDQIVAAVTSGAELAHRLLTFARQSPIEPTVVELSGVMRDAARWIERVIGDDVVVRLDLAATPLPVRADPGQLHQVLLNLALNARDAMPDGGELTIGTAPAGDRPAAQLIVRDDGVGMSPQSLEHAFDPFYTTKGATEGSGMGLSMVDGVVHQLAGTVALESGEGRGTVVRIELPLAPATESVERPRTPPPLPSSPKTVLVVEDRPPVRRAVAQILEGAGYRVLAGSGPDAALELIEGEVLDAVLTDVAMPSGGGERVVAELRAAGKEVPVVFMTGHSFTAEVLDGEILSKPFHPDELLRVMAKAIGIT